MIGRAEFGGDFIDWFPGYISNVEVFQQALNTAEVQALQGTPQTPAGTGSSLPFPREATAYNLVENVRDNCFT